MDKRRAKANASLYDPYATREVLLSPEDAERFRVRDAVVVATPWGKRVAARITDAWIEQVIDVGSGRRSAKWVVASRLTETTTGGVTVGEIRIFPFETALRGQPTQVGWTGRWSAEAAGHRATAPRSGVTTAVIRAISIGARRSFLTKSLRIDARELEEGHLGTNDPESAVAWLLKIAKGYQPFGKNPSRARNPGRGRPSTRTDLENATLARDYVAACEASTTPIQRLAEKRGLPVTAIRAAINRTRKLGFLTHPDAGPGVSGGMLTPLAEGLLSGTKRKTTPVHRTHRKKGR